MKRNTITRSLIFVGLLIAISWSLFHKPEKAPDVDFKTITGDTMSLRSLQGRPVLVTFWATSCKSCIEKIPLLNNLYTTYHQQGLEMVAVSMHYDQPSRVVNFSRVRQIKYPVALDIQQQLAQAFGNIELIPTTLLISPTGYIDLKTIGLLDIKDYQQRIEHFLQG